jgi:RNA polymerase sigma factor (sigma-70 family)
MERLQVSDDQVPAGGGLADPGVTDPRDTDPGATDPRDTDPGATNPRDADPSDTDPSDTDPSDTDPSDTELWERAGTDPAAFGVLFERHARRVFAYCARRTADLSLAEDLTSIVFLQAWTARKRVRLIEDSALPWLLGVAANVARNAGRSVLRHDAALARLPGWDHAEDPADRVAERVDAERRLAAAARAMTALRPAEVEVAQLVWWSGLSYEQAAVALDIPVGTVRSRLSRARSRIQDHEGARTGQASRRRDPAPLTHITPRENR